MEKSIPQFCQFPQYFQHVEIVNMWRYCGIPVEILWNETVWKLWEKCGNSLIQVSWTKRKTMELLWNSGFHRVVKLRAICGTNYSRIPYSGIKTYCFWKLFHTVESEPLRWLVLDKTEASCCLDLSLGYLWRAILAILRWNYERKKKHWKSDLGTKGQTCNTGILISVHEETRTKVSQIASQA